MEGIGEGRWWWMALDSLVKREDGRLGAAHRG